MTGGAIVAAPGTGLRVEEVDAQGDRGKYQQDRDPKTVVAYPIHR
jgi:hypothetical protein